MNTSLIAGLGFAILGAYFLRHALHGYRKALASHNWPSARGELVEVRLWGTRRVNGEMRAAKNLSVQYEYEVNEKSHSGTALAFYTLVYPATYDFAQTHPEKSSVDVVYNPQDPSESVLIPGLNKEKPYSDLILAGLGIIVGIAIAILACTGTIG